jgi:molybdate-binding protein
MLAGLDVVLIEWAWREQGLITAAGNPLQISGLQDLQRGPWRLVPRQEGAGSRLLLQHLLQAQGIDPTTLHFVTPPARSETDVALTIQAGKADIGFGIAAAARQCRLDFIPVHRERYDLALSRRDYFEPALQGLVAFMRPERLAEKAQELGGYDIAGMGRVIYNSP